MVLCAVFFLYVFNVCYVGVVVVVVVFFFFVFRLFHKTAEKKFAIKELSELCDAHKNASNQTTADLRKNVYLVSDNISNSVPTVLYIKF